jgi:hypothetical protein
MEGGGKSRHTTNEQSIACEHNTLVSILHVVADAILRVTRSVQCFDGDTISNLELITMPGGLGNRLAVLTTDDLESLELFQLVKQLAWKTRPNRSRDHAYNIIVTASMIPVAIYELSVNLDSIQLIQRDSTYW